LRRHFYKLVVGKIRSLALNWASAAADHFVGRGRAYIGKLLFFDDVNVRVVLAIHGIELTVLQFEQMSNTLTIRLPEDLSEWLTQTARETGVPRGRIIREQLERARRSKKQPFLRLAGLVAGPADLSTRKGFSRK